MGQEAKHALTWGFVIWDIAVSGVVIQNCVHRSVSGARNCCCTAKRQLSSTAQLGEPLFKGVPQQTLYGTRRERSAQTQTGPHQLRSRPDARFKAFTTELLLVEGLACPVASRG